MSGIEVDEARLWRLSLAVLRALVFYPFLWTEPGFIFPMIALRVMALHSRVLRETIGKSNEV
jgi:hypothetical protein